MLTKAYGESAISEIWVYEWYKRFQDGREDVEDDERPGRPSTSTTDENVVRVKDMVMNDRRITIREVADDVGIPIGSCHEIFLMFWVWNAWQQNLFKNCWIFNKNPNKPKQKQRRMEVAQESLTMPNLQIRQTWLRVTFLYFQK